VYSSYVSYKIYTFKDELVFIKKQHSKINEKAAFIEGKIALVKEMAKEVEAACKDRTKPKNRIKKQ
jgi:hypothetical protein